MCILRGFLKTRIFRLQHRPTTTSCAKWAECWFAVEMTLRGPYGRIFTESSRSSHGAWKPAPNAGSHIPTATTTTVPVLGGQPTPLKSGVPSNSCTEPKNLIAGLELCRALGIDFVSVTEAVDTSLPAGEMLFQMIGAVAQFERSLIAERVKSGLANARANGKILGRPPLRKLPSKEIADLRRQRAHGKVTFRMLAERFGVSVWTAHKLCAGRGVSRYTKH